MARAAQQQAMTAIQMAATRTSFIGCTTWNSKTGIVATTNAEATPAAGPANWRATTNVNHTSAAPASGLTTKMPSRPPSQTNGASTIENPAAQTGEAAPSLTVDGTNPAGASVRAASGHGAAFARSKVGCHCPCANAAAIKP